MMNYYEFKQAPFDKSIPPQNLYMTVAHEEGREPHGICHPGEPLCSSYG